MFFIQDAGHQSTEDRVTEKQETNCRGYSNVAPLTVLRQFLGDAARRGIPGEAWQTPRVDRAESPGRPRWLEL